MMLRKTKNPAFYFLAQIFIIALLSCSESPTENHKSGLPTKGDKVDFRLTDFSPAWSPDGKKIAYVHGDIMDGMTGIYLIDPNGANKKLLIAGVSAYSPDWSPDGSWLTFSLYAQIFKIKATGDSLTQLTFDGRNFYPSWSQDGKFIVYDSNVNSPKGGYSIWVMKNNGHEKTSLVGGRMASWGNRNTIYYIGLHGEVYQTDLTADNIIKITTLNQNNIYNTDNQSPRISPCGNYIAYTSQPYGGKPQIWIMLKDGSYAKQLTYTQGYTCDFSPDGTKIVYTDSRSVSGSLWIMDSDGSNKRQLTFNN